ncbi:MAG TPA: tRNA epoxyqueuosine(34) reductase QueG [Bryobacteraceae bacterium]
MPITAQEVKELAHACGFELAGVTAAVPSGDLARFETWREAGMAGEMSYMTDRRGDLRGDPRSLLPEAQSIVCVGKLYNTPHPGGGGVSRYAWGGDYHDVLRRNLERLLERIAEAHGEPFTSKICVDTAPLLERSYARAAGLGWIGKNTCLINQEQGSWFFLGELLLSIPLAFDAPPPDRCGSCRRCIEACPTEALAPDGKGGWTLDARLCISYLTIEKRGAIARELQAQTGHHLFGCDICQDVCPWNGRAPVTQEECFGPSTATPSLPQLAALTEEQFRAMFRRSPVWRAKYEGFLRNVAMAMGNSRNASMKESLEKLVQHSNQTISVTARTALLLLAASLAPAAASVSPGFEHFYNNEYDQALAYFERELAAHPDDPNAYNHIAQTVLYREMFRDGALESQLVSGNNPFLRTGKMEIRAEDKQRFAECIGHSIEANQARIAKNPRDVEALRALGVAHGLRANYLFLVEKSWMDALREATAARRANEKVLEIDPNLIDAHLILGLNQYVVGSLPFYLKLVGFLNGFHGDKEGGIRQLETVAAQGVRDKFDAKVLLAVIYRRERQPGKAIPLLEELAARFPRNYLFLFEQVQMYSDLGDKQSALRVLAEIEKRRRERAPGFATLPVEKVEFARGNLLFWYRDLDPALMDLKQVTKRADSLDLNTAVLAWLRVGQIHDLQGRHAEAIEAYRETVKTAPHSPAAEEARGYIKKPYHRDHDK